MEAVIYDPTGFRLQNCVVPEELTLRRQRLSRDRLDDPNVADDVSTVQPNQDGHGAFDLRSSISSCSRIIIIVSAGLVLLGAGISGAGYFLSFLGPSSLWVFVALLTLLASTATAINVFHLWKATQRSDIREILGLFLASVFFVLCAPLIGNPIAGTDQFGLYSLVSPNSLALVYLIIIVGSLLLSQIATQLFYGLYKWQYENGKGFRKSYQRSAVVVFPPLLMIYAIHFPLAATATCIALAVILAVFAPTFMAELALKDSQVNLMRSPNRDKLFTVTFVIFIALIVLGALSIIVSYAQPMWATLQISSLVHSWGPDLASLGLSQNEAQQLMTMNAAWSLVIVLSYMAVVLGGHLLIAVWEKTSSGSASSNTREQGYQASFWDSQQMDSAD